MDSGLLSPAAQYRAARTEAFRTWAEVTGVARVG
jgi:hypothetical protein